MGPTVIGAGTLGFLGLRQQRTVRARKLEYDAARDDLRRERLHATSTRMDVRVTRAELARVQAERFAGRADTAAVGAARHALDRAQREARAAAAAVRARRAHVSAARAALPAATRDPASLPLAKLMSTHDAITAQWMQYETDPAKLIAFPTMSDGRVPLTAAFLADARGAQELRPATAQTRMTAAQFSAYRDAVHRLQVAFDAAEADAWRRARTAGTAPAGPGPDAPGAPHWTVMAQTLTDTLLARSAEALARATGQSRSAAPSAAYEPAPPAAAAAEKTAPAAEPEAPPADPQTPPKSRDTPIWPIPRRGGPRT